MLFDMKSIGTLGIKGSIGLH